MFVAYLRATQAASEDYYTHPLRGLSIPSNCTSSMMTWGYGYVIDVLGETLRLGTGGKEALQDHSSLTSFINGAISSVHIWASRILTLSAVAVAWRS